MSPHPEKPSVNSGNQIVYIYTKIGIKTCFIVNKDIDSSLTDYINQKNIKVNYFIDGKYLEENMITVKFLSENNNIYYLGVNEEYSDEYMLYHNNLIGMNGTNESKYCFTNDKNSDILKLCNDYNMTTIKSDVIKDNVYKTIKDKLYNGVIPTGSSNTLPKSPPRKLSSASS